MVKRTRYTTSEEIEAMHQVIADAKQGRSYRQKRKSTIKLAGWVLFILLFSSLMMALTSISMAKSKGKTPELLGFQLYVIESGSMEPTLPVGSVILSRIPGDVTQLEEEDIVTFKTESGDTVTHRIIEVLTDDKGHVSYRTKGDNPINTPDPEILTPNRIIAILLLKIPLI